MLNPKEVIQAINKALEPFLIKGVGGYFSLGKYNSINVFRLKPNDACSETYNDYGNDGEIVSAQKWFNDYWLFVEIVFHNPPGGAIISLSVYQGDSDNKFKNQLFRAEWDDYGEEGTSHAQPHWHFLANKSIEYTIRDFAPIVPEGDTFMEVLDEAKGKTIDLGKFHFAMNGDWSNTSKYIHPLNNKDSLAKWFGGLLAYIKTQLEYIDNKRGTK